MSLFATITHPEAPRLGRITPQGIGWAVLGLLLAVLIGFVISETLTTEEETVTAPGLADVADVAPDAAMRMPVERLGVLTSPVVVPAIPSPVDIFHEMNVTSLGRLPMTPEEIAVYRTGQVLWDTNVTSLGYLPMTQAEIAAYRAGPAFWDANVTSLSYAVESIAEYRAGESFWDMNVTSLEFSSAFTERPGSPR